MKINRLLNLMALVVVVGYTPYSSAQMSPQLEGALIDVCKAAKSNNGLRLKQSMAAYNLKPKTVVLRVVCNGENIIDFAYSNQALKTAQQLERNLGNIDIKDIAFNHNNKWYVSIE